MSKRLIYDLPTRIFHWAFVVLFATSFIVAKTLDDENPLFSIHMIVGFLLGGLTLLRIIWGIAGTRYARFSSFALNPANLMSYVKGVFTGDKKRWIGHNPASSWATVIMFISALMLAVTGYLMTSGQKETFEDIHELFANLFLITALFHIAGVALHAIRHQDGIALTMITGKKSHVSEEFGITNQRPVIAFLIIVLMGTYGNYLYKNYDSNNQKLYFLGKTLQLGENENEDAYDGKENEKNDDQADDD